MKKNLLIYILSLCIGTSIFSESRVFVGGGLLFDANSLGGTIVKDGLKSAVSKKDENNNYAGNQYIVIPENELMALNRISGGLFSSKSNGAITAGIISVGFEKTFGKDDGFFFRTNVNLASKIMGGNTESKFLGYKWYEISYQYHSVVVPVFLGISLKANDSTSFYTGPGLHYFQASWNVKGTNDGKGLNDLMNKVTDSKDTTFKKTPIASDSTNPSVINEDSTFSAKGIGFSWLIGAQSKITDKGHLFVEVETHFSMKQGSANTKSAGGMAALSPMPVYPVTVAGNYYRFGYKHTL